MTLGEKLASLRKEQGYTQEQLAELLDISRQSVSKWESDLAYPETEKLLRLGTLFNCSMDYLLKDECAAPHSTPPPTPKNSLFNFHFEERKSDKTLFGLPLWHMADEATGFFAVGLRARGVVAVGLRAQGMVCIGLVTMGVFSCGAVSLGLVALGAAAVGLLAVGGIAVGLLSAGAVSFGVFAIGALANGDFSVGALALGRYAAWGDHAVGQIAIGKSEAAGDVIQILGKISAEQKTQITAYFETHIPAWLGWAKKLFLLFI